MGPGGTHEDLDGLTVCKARFRSFHIVCTCVFASFDSKVFWLLAVSTLITAPLLRFGFVFYVLRKEIEFCLLRASSDFSD